MADCKIRHFRCSQLPAKTLAYASAAFAYATLPGVTCHPHVRRQLLLCIDDNYFSRINDNYFLTLRRREAPAAGRRAKPARGPVLFLRSIYIRGGGKVGNLLLVFHFSIRPRRRSCGNVGISPAVGEIPKGLVERGGSLLLAFHAFHSPGISTALFPGVFGFGRRPQIHSASPWLSAC